MELEYKDSGVRPWMAGDAEGQRKSLREFDQREEARELERKAILAEPDPIRRRLATLRQKLRAAGMEV